MYRTGGLVHFVTQHLNILRLYVYYKEVRLLSMFYSNEPA